MTNHRAGHVTFYHLLVNQFGAGWAAHDDTHASIPDCTGLPLVRVHGTGAGMDVVYSPPWDEYEIEGTPQSIVFAASWVDLRTRFPPDNQGSRYLQWQGIKGAIWGSDSWSAANNGLPYPKKERRGRNGQMLNQNSGVKGTVTVQASRRWVRPTSYKVNGTEYWVVGNGDYISIKGEVLDFRRF